MRYVALGLGLLLASCKASEEPRPALQPVLQQSVEQTARYDAGILALPVYKQATKILGVEEIRTVSCITKSEEISCLLSTSDGDIHAFLKFGENTSVGFHRQKEKPGPDFGRIYSFRLREFYEQMYLQPLGVQNPSLTSVYSRSTVENFDMLQSLVRILASYEAKEVS